MKILRRAAAIALTLVVSQAWPQSGDWIALPFGTTQDMTVEASGDRSTRLPARIVAPPAKAASHALEVRLLDVAAKDGRGTPLAQAFHVTWAAAQAGHDPALVVTVPRDAAAVRPGTYTLSLRVSPDLGDAKLSAQALTITLTVPAPALTIDPVLVGQVIGLPPFERDESLDGSLRVTEKGGLAGAHALRVSTLADLPATGMPLTATLAVPAAAADVGREQAITLPIAASGPFPVGRSTGRIEVRSPDLATPLSTTYEVRVVRSATWMIPIVLAGFLIGYFTRTWLARAKARNAALLLASKAVAAINARLEAVDDAASRGRLIAIRETLARAVAPGVPQDITTAAADAQTALGAEAARLEERLVPLRQQAATLQTLADRPWRLPAAIESAMAPLRQDVAALPVLLARSNAGAVESALSNGVATDLAAILDATQASGAAAARWMHELDACALPLADDDAALVRESAAALTKQYPPAAPDATSGTSDDVSTALNAYIGLSSVAAKVLAQLPQAADSFGDWAAARMRSVSGTIADQIGMLKSRARTLLDPAALESGLRGAPVDGFIANVSTLRDDWMAMLKRLAPAAPFATIDAALQAASWEKAIEAFCALQSAAFLGGPAPAAQTATPSAPAMVTPKADALPVAFARALETAPIVLHGTLAEQERLLRSGEVTSWVQSIVLAVLFLVANYLLYRESWVGTDKEIVALFLLAFGLDLSADNVLAALKKA